MIGFSEEPAVPYGAKLDKTAFLAWVQRQEGGRYELKDGQIVMHAGTTKHHARISTRFATALSNALDPETWDVTGPDFAVEIGDDIRYPDVMVEPLSDGPNVLTTTTPVLLVEVLSPSSAGRDMNMKLAEYTSLASLECYIVASQDEPIVWLWQRDGEERAFPKLATEIAGRDKTIDIASLGLSLPLAEIYRGIGSAT